MLRKSPYRGLKSSLSKFVSTQFPKHRGSRPFAQHTRRFLLPLVSPRPQLPFLHAPSHGSHPRNWKVQLSRLINTETQRTIRDTTYGGLRWYVGLTVATLCLFSVFTGVTQWRLERIYPTPPEWRFFTRIAYRDAAAVEDDEGNGSPVDWPQVGPAWRKCLAKLEESGKSDAQELTRVETGLELKDVPVWDATRKSEQWKRGYFEVVMGCGRASERLLGWYQDETRPFSRPVPGDVIIGPSNLDPRPLPPEQGTPPKEENCKPVMEAPQVFYQRVINGKGFSRRQQLFATLALADYLDSQKNHTDAEHYYRDGLDLACSVLPNPEKSVDRNTGVIKENASQVSNNMLLASTALAVHFARTANTAGALPIFLSALRATREGNFPQGSPELDFARPPSLMDTIMDFLKDRPYPPPPPSGDEPLGRPSESCSEPSLMAYVGEILFVTSKTNKDREQAIAWTKDAADLAESRASQISKDRARKEQFKGPRQRLVAEGIDSDVEVCRQCLGLGLTNLQTMVLQMIQRDTDHGAREGKETKSFWPGDSAAPSLSASRWGKELEVVATRLERFKEEQIQRMMAGQAGGKPIGFPRIR